jgi:hypothetical protein
VFDSIWTQQRNSICPATIMPSSTMIHLSRDRAKLCRWRSLLLVD